MRHIKWFFSIIAVLILLTGCSEKSATSGKEEKETAVDAPAATEQAQTEETQQAEQASAGTTEQPAEQSEEGNSTENTNKAASSNATASSNAASSTNQTQESSKPAASAQTVVSQPPKEAAASQSSQVSAAPAPAAAPSPAASQPQQEQKPETAVVTLSIRDNQTTILSKTTVELQEGDTVFTVLARTMKKKGIQMEYTGSGQSVYVQGINNLYEMDRGPKSGWRYYVNGALANKSAGVFKLTKGDKVEWRYTDDYTKGGQ